jgi:flagellar motility protein MotE (MotC chaperone)
MGVSIDIMTTDGGLGGTALSLSSKKAADILTAMISQAENALRGIMTAIDVDNAATIVSKMDPAAVKMLFRQLISETDLPPGMSIPPQHQPFVTKEKAVAILASDNMSVDTAAKILSNFTFADAFLAELDKTDKVKADQIRAKIAATDKSWLNDLGNLKPEDAAAKIAAYVKDAATAKEVADALNKLEPFKAGQIIAQSGMTAQLAAQVFDQMTAQQVAGILNSNIVPIRFYDGVDLVNCPPAYRVISYLKAAEILVAMDNGKAGAALAALPAYTAGNILFAQDPGNTQPAVTNMKIIYLLKAMSADSAASIISAYCDPLSALKGPWLTNDMLAKPKAAIPARVEQIFRKMVPSESAPIFASDNMSVKTAARIISEVKKGFPDKANLILNAIDAVNPEKATWIRTVINVLEGNYVPGPFIVKFKAEVSDKAIADTLKSVGGKVESVHNITSTGTFYLVSFPETISIVDALSLLQQTKLVQYAEPNFVRTIGG